MSLLNLTLTMDFFSRTPWQYNRIYLRPRFAYILDHMGMREVAGGR